MPTNIFLTIICVHVSLCGFLALLLEVSFVCLFASDLFINLCSFLFVLGTQKSPDKEDKKEEGE